MDSVLTLGEHIAQMNKKQRRPGLAQMDQLVLVRTHAVDNDDGHSREDEVMELVMEDPLFQGLLGRAKSAQGDHGDYHDAWLTACTSTVSEWQQCLEKNAAVYDGLAQEGPEWKYRLNIAVTYTHNKKLIDAFLLLRPPSRVDARVRACDPACDTARFFQLFEVFEEE